MTVRRHTVVRTLPYDPTRLFDLVGDVRAYPEFIPWLKSIRTGPTRHDGARVSILDAEADVGFSFLKERFSTRVRRDAEALVIEVSLISGPFKRLVNRWRFEPAGEGAIVTFNIEFEFRTRMLDRLLDANFESAVARLIGCFEDRAKALYGPVALRP